MDKALQVRNWSEHYENSESRKISKTTFVCVPNKHDGKGYARIAAHPKSCQVFAGWMLILQIASKMPQRGLLVDEDGALDVDDMAVMTRFRSDVFKDAIAILTGPKVRWLEWVELPNTLVKSGRKQDEIPVSPDTSRQIPEERDAPGRTEQNRTEQNGTVYMSSCELDDAKSVLEYLNEKAGRNYRPVPAHIDLIRSRLRETGVTPAGIREMIDAKCADWHGNPDMSQYLRPQTLFNRSKFAGYYDARGQTRITGETTQEEHDRGF